MPTNATATGGLQLTGSAGAALYGPALITVTRLFDNLNNRLLTSAETQRLQHRQHHRCQRRQHHRPSAQPCTQEATAALASPTAAAEAEAAQAQPTTTAATAAVAAAQAKEQTLASAHKAV
jgi:hypothetical protein